MRNLMGGLSNPVLFAIAYTNLICSQSQFVLPQKSRRRCEASEKRSFSQEFLSHTLQRSQSVWHCPQIGVGRYGFCRTGVVMDWSNKSDEIYFNHFYYNKTTKNGVFSHAAPPHTQLALIPQSPPKNTKKRTQAVRILEFS